MAKYEPYLDKASKSIFRFEGLQDYTAEDGEEFVKKYIETGQLLEKPEEILWCRNLRGMNERGIVTQRVRLVKLPLNDYTKTELAWYRAAAEYSGDDIRLIEQEDFDKIFETEMPDFWMVDDMYTFPMEYGPKGKFLGDMLVEGKEVEAYVQYKIKLINNSVSVEGCTPDLFVL